MNFKLIAKKTLCTFLFLATTTAGLNIYATTDTSAATSTAKTQPLDSIATIVNKDIITQREFTNALNGTRAQFQQNGITLPSEAVLKKSVLDGLIYQKLQLQLAKQNGITATKTEVDATLKRIAAQNHVTVEQMKGKLQSQGLTLKKLRRQIQDQIVISKLQAKAVRAANVTANDIANFRKQHHQQLSTAKLHLIDLVIPLPSSPTKLQINRAKTTARLLSQALRRQSIDTVLAKKAYKKVEKNDLGWRKLNDLPGIFIKPAGQLQRGQTSPAIIAPNGIHLLKLLDRQKGESQVNDAQIKKIVFRKMQQEKVKQWLKKIRKNAYIQINVKF